MMKYPFIFSLFTLALTPAFAETKVNMQSNEAQKLGYGLGYRITETTMNTFSGFDLTTFLQGVNDAVKTQPPQLTREQMNESFDLYTKKKHNQKSATVYHNLQRLLEVNAEKEKQFLAENMKKPQIKHTRSGLQYEVLQKGQGKKPKINQSVQISYEGRLLDGEIFNSSIARQHTETVELKQLIQGLQEGIMLMPTGSQYRFYIPARLAYGEIGAGDIPPNNVVIFDVELLAIE